MTLSKRLLCALVLILLIVPIESRTCYYLEDLRLCETYCCGKAPFIKCKEDCNGVECNNDADCGNGCCSDYVCEDCLMSPTIIAVIAGCGAFVLIFGIVACLCCCECCRSQPRHPVVGLWAEMSSANNMSVSNPAVTVVQTSSHVHMQEHKS